MLLEQEKQRNLEKQKEELAKLNKLQTQLREEQQQWEKEREGQRIAMATLEAQVQQREEECKMLEEKLNVEKSELETQREHYQQDLERLREATRSVDKEREHLTLEKERLEKLMLKLSTSPGHSNYDTPPKVRNRKSDEFVQVQIILNSDNLKLLIPTMWEVWKGIQSSKMNHADHFTVVTLNREQPKRKLRLVIQMLND